ncbi:MAG: ECF transporter S component [Streptococcaceae bacterium]|jgi:uncharacterized membrane protein|nr:ECF transporter S component [Streptococcaceae bacterium]
MRRKKTNDITIVAMFLAVISVLMVINQVFVTFWPFPIKPTILQVPVIIASLVLGPKLGGIIGAWWGVNSVINSTIITMPLSFVFSPLQPVPGTEYGDIRALIVAIVPRILVGILPYYIYKLFQGKAQKFSLIVVGGFGSIVNTIFVLGAIYWFFGNVLGWNLQIVLASIVATNSVAEMIVAAILTMMIAPTLMKVYEKR